MKKFSLYLVFTASMLTFGYLSSCKKDTTLKLGDTETVQENLQQNEEVSDTFIEITSLSGVDIRLFEAPQQVVNSTESNSTNIPSTTNSGCKTVTISPTGDTFPKTVTIDFGTGCDDGGKVRKGKIVAVFSGRLKDAGSTVTITFDNFYINNDKIEGTKTITNNGLNSAGKLNFTVVVNHTRSLSTGGTVTFSLNKTFTWLEGASTANPGDDIFSISGTESGTDAKGRNFSTSTLEPLIKKVGCHFIVAGKLEIHINDRPVNVIDFGDGTCDNKAILTVEGVSKEISLRK